MPFFIAFFMLVLSNGAYFFITVKEFNDDQRFYAQALAEAMIEQHLSAYKNCRRGTQPNMVPEGNNHSRVATMGIDCSLYQNAPIPLSRFLMPAVNEGRWAKNNVFVTLYSDGQIITYFDPNKISNGWIFSKKLQKYLQQHPRLYTSVGYMSDTRKVRTMYSTYGEIPINQGLTRIPSGVPVIVQRL